MSRAGKVATLLMSVPAAALVLLCCGLPLAWLAGTVLGHPAVLKDVGLSSFRWALLARTLLYNAGAGVLATFLALPVALVLGRGPCWLRRALWFVVPASLLMPSLAYAYGWAQFVRLTRPMWDVLGIGFDPAGLADVVRCIWTLAAWLWPIPAAIIGIALQRMDTNVQQQATMDGALWRITLRQLLGPIIASLAIVTLLAAQEFAVYEPTGISVVATEIRMVFETGAFSGLANPMIGPVGSAPMPDQAGRAAAAIATAVPLLVVMLLLAGLAAWKSARMGEADELSLYTWPRVLRAPTWAAVASVLLVLVTLGVPVIALIASLRIPFSTQRVWTEFGPEVTGSLIVAAIAAMVALVLGFSSAVRWTPGVLVVSGLSFLVGGQLLAIAFIRIWNRPGLSWAYDAFPVPVLAYMGRFGWIALAAVRGTWSTRWRELRAMAAVDGATPLGAAVAVVWPMAWPAILAAALLVGALSMTEVPATVLLRPQCPEVLTPMLMTWVHMTRYDPMIEASLLMMGMVLGAWLAVLAVAAVVGRRRL